MARAPKNVHQPTAPAPEAAQGVNVNAEVGRLERMINAATINAKTGGLPNGYIVAVLHALALKETQRLLGQE
ncbi:hypothetical protein N5D61_02835 [Pseudomonas sp. GD03842]|uniref:hypothetical protein n=1 Tax=Pseudomonas sp. GD03842 TaxID=2975385 RepID=UPI002447BE85|nr:hypothetical protein [Pseudomonas sp. GD03842]MDH0745279.1 hypothetical protein [Pseudomonas sp. GD03842]